MKREIMDVQRPAALEEDDKRYIWHPYTQMADYVAEQPLIIREARGIYLVDIHGRHYLDGVSSLWVNLHGHRHPLIDRAVREQLALHAHSTLLGLSNVPAIELARQLVEIAPRRLARVFYSDSGSTAVEIALKMSYQFWQQGPAPDRRRRRFVAFKNAYHGDTLGAVAVGQIPRFQDIFRPLVFEPLVAESPYCYRCPLGKTYPSCQIACLGSLEEILEGHGEEVAAVIIEPLVQAAAGMIVAPPGFLKKVRELCDTYGIYLIADEVAVGFGRTGTMFACEQEEVSPDFLCLAKGITGGYLPLAATLTTQSVFDGFLGDSSSGRTFFHGHTYTGNPLACAAALANLEVFRREKTLQFMKEKISLLEGLVKGFWDIEIVGDVRQKGFMIGIELVEDRESRQPFPPVAKMGHRVTMEARKRGLIIRPLGDVVVLMPPLAASPEQLKDMVNITVESVKAVAA